MSQSTAHPVYIQRQLKDEVKKESADLDVSMKEMAEALITEGMEESFHVDPLPEGEKTDGSDETHPIYIGDDLKKELKKESVDLDAPMRRLAERLISRGFDEGLHKALVKEDEDDEE